MEKKKKLQYTVIIIAIILCISSFIGSLLSIFYAKNQYAIIVSIVEDLILENPEDEQKILNIIKTKSFSENSDNILISYGFEVSDLYNHNISIVLSVVFGVLFIAIILGIIYLIKNKNKKRIHELTRYLEEMNIGNNVEIFNKEDIFTPLEDEIYKTVTQMKNERNKAIKDREEFAESLTNIAHQIKTPLTAMSLNSQIEENIKLTKQVDRLNKLVDSLLIMGKMDAGVLNLKKEKVDIYTLIELSMENLERMITEKNIKIELINCNNISFMGDLEWSIEALINILKNCIEHSPQNGKIEIEGISNSLYIEIIIKDNGEGFDKEELRNIFKRFYRGKSLKNGIGVGLSIAKKIIELQNGFITAENSEKGGAKFNIRFYCH